jgi:hypothetical protein
MNGDDVRMIQLGGRFGLGTEALHIGGRGQLPRQDHFQGHDAVETGLPAFKTTPMPPQPNSPSTS